MIQKLANEISNTHREIRRELHRIHICQRCLAAFEEERSFYLKSNPYLKKKIKRNGASLGILSVFVERLKGQRKKNNEEYKELLLVELNIRASLQIIPFIRSRLKKSEANKQCLRSLNATKKRLLLQLEKFSMANDISPFQKLDTYFLKIADLQADMEELISARSWGEKIQKVIQTNIQELLRAEKEEWPIDFDNPLVSGPLLDKLFSNAVTAEIHICAFKNVLREFPAGRDMNFHLEGIRDYKSTFFNNLILDCENESKIRFALPYSRSFLNSLQAVLKTIDSRLIRINNELMVNTIEKEAILARISQKGNDEEPHKNGTQQELLNRQTSSGDK